MAARQHMRGIPEENVETACDPVSGRMLLNRDRPVRPPAQLR